MSTVRYINNVPHIFRYGRQDEGSTWHQFWRNAVRFDITCRKDDIAGTAFEQEWSALCTGQDTDPPPPNWVETYNCLCDLVATQCQPLLNTLAPRVGGRRWVTVEDYLRTPAYKLEMYKDPTTGEAVAHVVDGPTIQPAYEMRLCPMSIFGDLFAGVGRVRASEVVVQEQGVDYRQPPSMVIDPNTGAACRFKRTERPVRSVETGEVSNPSIAGIVQILKGKAKDAEGVKVEPLAAVITSEGAEEHSKVGQNAPANAVEMVAGILHT